MRRHVVRTKKRRQANADSEDAPESWSFVQFVALFVCITGLLCMVFQLRLVASDRGPQLRQDFGQAFRHRLKMGAAELGAYQERRESIAPTREDVGRVPSNDDLVRQLAEIDKVQREAAEALSPWRAGRQQAPQRSETAIESTHRISVETKPSTSHGASDKTRSCEWDRHVGQYLGEYLDSGVEVDLLEAQEKCISAGVACAGVTCMSSAESCNPRRGLPYLAASPSPREVSYTKKCPKPVGEQSTSKVLKRTPMQPTSREPLRPEDLLIVVLAHNRPDCLDKCMRKLADLEEVQNTRIAVSLDEAGAFPAMEAVVQRFKTDLRVEVWHKRAYVGVRGPVNSKTPVSKIAEHFRFALEESFERQHFEFAIFLENDLFVAPDFLWYFRATAWLLKEDDTLFCVSAWNDNGLPELVSNETRLFRTDYFPGLGWMIQNKTWHKIRQEWPRYPSTGWDHWLRHGSGLYPHECIAPEVSRTHHFDTRGTNVKVGSPMAKKLSGMPFSSLKPGKLGDLSYLLQESYEEQLQKTLSQAILVPDDKLENLDRNKVYLVPFLRRDWKRLSAKLKLNEAQPRSAHRGVILTRDHKSGALLFLADRMKSHLLPEAERVVPHAKQHVQKGMPGESCGDVCNRIGMHCADLELEFVNNCAALKQHFRCEEGCGHQVGQEIPCYVHEATKDTGRQCLVTDDAIPLCSSKNKATTRLCTCLPA